jgi:hypothetical protein
MTAQKKATATVLLDGFSIHLYLAENGSLAMTVDSESSVDHSVDIDISQKLETVVDGFNLQKVKDDAWASYYRGADAD